MLLVGLIYIIKDVNMCIGPIPDELAEAYTSPVTGHVTIIVPNYLSFVTTVPLLG